MCAHGDMLIHQTYGVCPKFSESETESFSFVLLGGSMQYVDRGIRTEHAVPTAGIM